MIDRSAERQRAAAERVFDQAFKRRAELTGAPAAALCRAWMLTACACVCATERAAAFEARRACLRTARLAHELALERAAAAARRASLAGAATAKLTRSALARVGRTCRGAPLLT